LKSSIYHSPNRFRNTNRVSEQAAAGWKSSDYSTGGMQRESQRLGVRPRNTAILTYTKTYGLSGQPEAGSLRHRHLGFLGVTIAILSYDIHLGSDKLAFQKDAAALGSLETHSRQDDSRIGAPSLPSATASRTGSDRVDAQPEEILQSAPPKPSVIAGLVSAVGRKKSTDSGAARRQP